MDNNLNFRGCKAEMFGKNRLIATLGLIGLLVSTIFIYGHFSGEFVLSGRPGVVLFVVFLIIMSAFQLVAGAIILIFPKRCPAYRYVLEQLGIDVQWHKPDRSVFDEIDDDIRQSGVRQEQHSPIILSDNWIWIDSAPIRFRDILFAFMNKGAIALRRDNLKGFHMLIKLVSSSGRAGWYNELEWLVKIEDKNGKEILVVRHSDMHEFFAWELYQLLCETFPDLPHRVVKPKKIPKMFRERIAKYD